MPLCLPGGPRGFVLKNETVLAAFKGVSAEGAVSDLLKKREEGRGKGEEKKKRDKRKRSIGRARKTGSLSQFVALSKKERTFGIFCVASKETRAFDFHNNPIVSLSSFRDGSVCLFQ